MGFCDGPRFSAQRGTTPDQPAGLGFGRRGFRGGSRLGTTKMSGQSATGGTGARSGHPPRRIASRARSAYSQGASQGQGPGLKQGSQSPIPTLMSDGWRHSAATPFAKRARISSRRPSKGPFTHAPTPCGPIVRIERGAADDQVHVGSVGAERIVAARIKCREGQPPAVLARYDPRIRAVVGT
jgi:hypothetical protein